MLQCVALLLRAAFVHAEYRSRFGRHARPVRFCAQLVGGAYEQPVPVDGGVDLGLQVGCRLVEHRDKRGVVVGHGVTGASSGWTGPMTVAHGRVSVS